MSYWKDKVVLVTGGSRGLGRVIAEEFAAAGAKLALIALEPETVERTAEEIRARGADALGVSADITKPEDVERAMAQTLERFGRLDVLVNNAGRSDRGNAFETPPEKFREHMELNFIALVRCTQAALPHLLKRQGHVVNIGSLAAKSAARWVGAYPATKFAVAAFTQQLRLELGPQGLHAMLVCPGPIRRQDPRPYEFEGLEELPARAGRPGAGIKAKAMPPQKVARAILRGCRRRLPELMLPRRARWYLTLMQLCPRLGDWIVLKKTGGNEK
ncbi:MAG: SDR family NAD(P)-dependent oxidoreductase [Pirellulales bacterium]|nr:SDR family NAD(P)-dependent oxidoreductase [Pirellulales bacterium]